MIEAVEDAIENTNSHYTGGRSTVIKDRYTVNVCGCLTLDSIKMKKNNFVKNCIIE